MHTDAPKGEQKQITIPVYGLDAVDPSEKNADWALTYYQRFIYNLQLAVPYARANSPVTCALLRAYGQGTQPESIYRKQFDPQGAMAAGAGAQEVAAYTGLNFANIINPIPKYKSVVSSKIDALGNKFDSQAVDPEAKNLKEQARLKLSVSKELDDILSGLSRMAGLQKPVKSNIQQEVLGDGVSALQDIEFNVDNQTELNIYMDVAWKPKVALASDITTEALMVNQNFDEVKQLWEDDALDYAVVCGQVRMSAITALPVISYLFPEKVAIGKHMKRDGSDARFWEYRDLWTVNDCIDRLHLTLDEARDLFKRANTNGYYVDGTTVAYNNINVSWFPSAFDFENVTVQANYFEFKTVDIYHYSATDTDKGSTRLKRVQRGYKPPKGSKSRVETREAEMVYKGYYIPLLNKIYAFGKLENQIREAGKEQPSQFSLVYRRFRDRSFVHQLMPMADNIQINYLKYQLAVLKALPPGYSFDWSALQDIALGDGGKLSKLEQIRIFHQTGSKFHRSRNEMDEPILANANAVDQHMPNGLDANLEGYWRNIFHEMELMEGICGIPPVVAGSAPEPRTTNEAQKLAVAGAEKATYYLIDGFAKVMERTASNLMLLVQDMSRFKGEGWEALKAMVGRTNLDIIDSMGRLHKHQFAIKTLQQMSDAEKQQLNLDVQQAYIKGEVSLTDKLMVTFMRDYREAIALLNVRMKRREEQSAKAMEADRQFQMAMMDKQLQVKQMESEIDYKKGIDTAQITQQGNLAATQLKEQGKALNDERDLRKKSILQHQKIEGDKTLTREQALADSIFKQP